jgi:hypothetical protein
MHRLARALSTVAAVMVLVGCSAASPSAGGSAGVPARSPSVPVEAAPAQSPSPTASVAAAARRWIVSELLAAREAGDVHGGPIVLAGFWSTPSGPHSCAAPHGNPGDLEIYCHDGEYGITERNEPVGVLTATFQWVPTDGPMLTPWLPTDLAYQVELPWINGQPYPPVPIVVAGHLDDPRAAECRPVARKLCEDRFVVDEILEWDPGAVPTPGVSPTPSPFPFDSPPPSPFTAADCQTPAGRPAAFSHVGWVAVGELALTNPRTFRRHAVYVAIAEDVVPLGEWFMVEGDTRPSRPMGRLVCIAEENDGTVMSFDSVAGSAFRVYQDGSTAPPG